MDMALKAFRGSVLAMALFAASGIAFAQESPAQLAALAREARTTGEHADVAKRYRMLADSLDMEAAKHEVRVQKLSKNAPAIAHKWPAMASKDLTQAKQQAVEARRAAKESRELAAHHQSLAVEALPAQQ
jgi:hypothetical protein